MNEEAVRDKLAETLHYAAQDPEDYYQVAWEDNHARGDLYAAADALLPVVREIAAEELREAAEELDDIAAHLDPQQRSTGTPRGYRLSAHHNRSIAAVLTSSHE